MYVFWQEWIAICENGADEGIQWTRIYFLHKLWESKGQRISKPDEALFAFSWTHLCIHKNSYGINIDCMFNYDCVTVYFHEQARSLCIYFNIDKQKLFYVKALLGTSELRIFVWTLLQIHNNYVWISQLTQLEIKQSPSSSIIFGNKVSSLAWCWLFSRSAPFAKKSITK